MFYALLASIVWWLDYAITWKILEKVSYKTIISLRYLIWVIFVIIFLIFYKDFWVDIKKISQDKNLSFMVITSVLLTLLWVTLINISISKTNATIASIIEISYPIFVVIATYILFKENHLKVSIIIWWILIFIWILIIFKYSK